MKKHFINKLFTIAGFLLLAFVALNMNACSKDKDGGGAVNPYGQYGYGPGVGGSHLGNGLGVSGDGSMTLQLVFAGQNGGQAGATGTLWVQGYTAGCALYPGTYTINTVQPGRYYNGDFENMRLMANNGIELYVQRGWLQNQQDQYGNRRMYADVNIPGCPTMFQ